VGRDRTDDAAAAPADEGVAIRAATDQQHLAVRRLLDVALLDVEGVDDRVDDGDVLVATGESTVLGTVVLEPRERGARVVAIAVRRRRRDEGIGRALIAAARERYGRLTAGFDAGVRPFYESLGFEIEPAEETERYRGVLDENG
jgi:GNAT superfamily N-acetyltransferase